LSLITINKYIQYTIDIKYNKKTNKHLYKFKLTFQK